eukprot:s28_g34.t1
MQVIPGNKLLDMEIICRLSALGQVHVERDIAKRSKNFRRELHWNCFQSVSPCLKPHSYAEGLKCEPMSELFF